MDFLMSGVGGEAGERESTSRTSRILASSPVMSEEYEQSLSDLMWLRNIF